MWSIMKILEAVIHLNLHDSSHHTHLFTMTLPLLNWMVDVEHGEMVWMENQGCHINKDDP